MLRKYEKFSNSSRIILDVVLTPEGKEPNCKKIFQTIPDNLAWKFFFFFFFAEVPFSFYFYRYNSLGDPEKKRLEHDEDKLLSVMLYNHVGFMVMMDVKKIEIKKKIRRLLGKSHIGLHYSQDINNLLDEVNKLVSFNPFITYLNIHIISFQLEIV